MAENMTFSQALDFIHATGNLSRPGLERITELMHRLGDVQNTLRFVHVAGTNGKGSTCAMLERVLRAVGYRTGLYTSPHLLRVTERIKVNGEEISDAEFAACAARVREAMVGMDDAPTEFERITAMALCCFAAQKCDVVVLEVGLGGRLDGTNVIAAPEVSVIAGIGLEHTDWLGDTVEKIAFEKGGIIKPGCPVVLSRQSESVEAVIDGLCRERGCALRVTAESVLHESSIDGQRFDYGAHRDLFLPLLGGYQLQNAALAVETLDLLSERGWHIPEVALREGLSQVQWPARLEVLQREPLVLLDGAHNPNGVDALERALTQLLPGQKVTLVMGVMADKDFGEMLDTMAPHAARFVAAAPDYYRALPSDKLAQTARAHLPCPVLDGGSVPQALKLALTLCEGAPVVVFGSLYQAGEVRSFFGRT